MASNDEIVRQRQSAIRREMDRRGIALKAVSYDSGIPYATLLSYFPQEGGRDPVMLPVSALYALANTEALPLDLLSLVLPAGNLIVKAPESVDHDEASSAMRSYLKAKDEAHHPDSPGGRDIAPCEDEHLRGKLTLVGSVAA